MTGDRLKLSARSWMNRAACRGADPKLFFQAEYKWGKHQRNTARVSDALRFCDRCPVRQECAGYARQAGIRSGIWGGVDLDA